MGYTVGDLLEFKQEALTESIRVIRSRESFWGLTNVFTEVRQQEGTDVTKWSIFNENRKLGKWAVRNSPARPMDLAGGRKLSAPLGHIFMSATIDEDVLLLCQSPEENAQERAVAWIQDAQEQLVALGDNLLEAAIWEILLTGELAIDQSGDPNHPIIQTITFGIAAAHVADNTTLDWSLPASKILSDTASGEAWGDLLAIPEDDGFVITDIVMNRLTNRYLFGNTEIQKLWSDKRRDILIEKANITRLDGADVWTYNKKYEDDAGSLQNFVIDDHIIGLPSAEDRRRVFHMMEGETMVPDMNRPDKRLMKAMGAQSWVEYSSNPAEARIFYKRNVMPVVRIPDAFFSRKVKL